MNILEKIVNHKRKEVAERVTTHPIKLLEKSIYFKSDPVSLKKYILREDKNGIIAEFKRQSPSKGIINEFGDVEKISIGYMQAGASAISILTDSNFFGGNLADFIIARKFNYCPILRKDFIINEYQIIEAKSIGADAILLIASVLSKAEIKQMARLAISLGMEVLLEIHNKNELDKYDPAIELIGINNRKLTTFEVNFEHAISLSQLLPKNTIKIAESGIKDPKDIRLLRSYGFNGFLIGEQFMKHNSPQLACKKFISQINQEDYVTT